MKRSAFILSALILLNMKTSGALEIKNVKICATTCNSESLAPISHDVASVGTIYYTKKSDCNYPEAIEVFSNRLTENSLNSCLDALMGKYEGQLVDFNTAARAEVPNDDLGSYFSIKLSR
jgi:hypothetical protein